MEIEQVISTNIHFVYQFLESQDEISPHFRYFNTRNPQDVIPNHILTIVGRAKQSTQIMAYAHIDYDTSTNKHWLGICVYSSYQGQGYGSQCMKYLLSYADSHTINLSLSVDADNTFAIQMYAKYGFVETSRSSRVIYMMRRSTHE